MITTAQDTAIDRLCAALHEHTGHWPRGHGRQRSAICPTHDDTDPSLSITDGNDRVLLLCQAGCDTDDILTALKLTRADLFNEPREKTNKTAVIAEYKYTDKHGKLLFIKQRRVPKDFRIKRPDGRGGWVWNLKDTPRVLYRLQNVLAAIRDGKPIYLVEGEKDVHAAEKAGAAATCNYEGAAKEGQRTKWRPEYGDTLKGAHVIIVADNDDAGVAHARAAAADLKGKAATVRIVRGLIDEQHADLSDHLAAGHTLDQLAPLDAPRKDTVGAEHDDRADDDDYEADPDARRLIIAPASQLKVKAPKWLYDRRIPAGAVSLLAGREGIGKSTCAAWIIAMITRGKLPGRFNGKPRGVIIVATEDSWNEVILPRLIAAGADLDLVFRVEAQEPDGTLETVTVPKDLEQMRVLCAEYSIALIVVDPIMSVIDGKLDTHRDREVRQALDPLARFAATNGVAVLGLIHVNKSGTGDPLNSVMGSRAFTAVARSVLYCITDPESEDDETFVFGHVKSNLGPKMPSRKYEIYPAKVDVPDPEPGDDTYVTTSRVKWGEEDQRSIRELMDTPKGGERPTGELTQAIEKLLRDRGTISVEEICQEFPDTPSNTVRQTLARMAKRGTLFRPVRGFYRLADDDVSDTDSDARDSVTSVTTVTNQDRSDTSDTCDTKDVSREVSQTLSQPKSGRQWDPNTQGAEMNDHSQ